MQAGQHVRVEVKNMNILGVQLDLQDKSRYTYKKNWLGIESKVYTGDSHSMVLLPGQTRSFDFYMFDYVPMNWQFEISTNISDAANVQIRFYSDWVPGMPYDPNYPSLGVVCNYSAVSKPKKRSPSCCAFLICHPAIIKLAIFEVSRCCYSNL
jgi:hypothetical protein